MTELERRLKQPATAHECYVPVGGLSDDGLPAKLGRTRLVVMNESQLRRLRSPKESSLSGHKAAGRHRIWAGVRNTDSWNKAAALVEVQARDEIAAGSLAKRQVRQVLDTLNFFADMIPYSHGWVYMPSEATAFNSAEPVRRADGSLYVAFAMDGPLRPFSMMQLKSTKSLQPALVRVHGLMREKPESSLGSTLLTSLQWAGRASVDPRREQAFLLFTIALETLLLPESDRDELGHRLRTRAAHLLGQDLDSRREISAQVRNLYTIRSKIVHSGSYEVTDEDLGQLRSIAKRCILRALLHRQIRQLTTNEQLREWFEHKVLQ